MANKYPGKSLLIVAAFLILLIGVLAYALSRVEDTQPIKEILLVENESQPQVYRVNTDPFEPSAPINIETSDRYDEKYLEYLDSRQEARDNTASGR